MNYASRTMSITPAINLADEKEFRLGILLVRPSTREILFHGRFGDRGAETRGDD